MSDSAITNEERLRQVCDFRGLDYGGGKLPGDLDGFYDESDKLFVFIEVKYRDAPMREGQRIAYERLCDACAVPGRRRAAVLVCTHNVADAREAIDAASCIVTRYRLRGRWRTPLVPVTCRQAFDSLKHDLDAKLAAERARTRDVMQGFGIEVDF